MLTKSEVATKIAIQCVRARWMKPLRYQHSGFSNSELPRPVTIVVLFPVFHAQRIDRLTYSW